MFAVRMRPPVHCTSELASSFKRHAIVRGESPCTRAYPLGVCERAESAAQNCFVWSAAGQAFYDYIANDWSLSADGSRCLASTTDKQHVLANATATVFLQPLSWAKAPGMTSTLLSSTSCPSPMLRLELWSPRSVQEQHSSQEN